MASASSAGDQLSGTELVREFVRATERMAPGAGAALAGISTATYERWLRQAPHVLRGPQRARIERFLQGSAPEVWLG